MPTRRTMLTAALAAAVGGPLAAASTASASVSVAPISVSLSPYVETVAVLDACDMVNLYNYGQGGWTNLELTARAVYIGAPGVFAILPDSNDIAIYNGTPGSWTTIGGPGAQFAIGGSYLYGLGPSGNYVAVWNGLSSGWAVIGGAASAIAAGGYGLVAKNPAGNAVYRYVGGSWTQIGDSSIATGSTFSVSDSGIYAVTAAGVVEQWAGGMSWTVIGSGVQTLHVGGDGVYGVQSSTGDIAQYNGTPGYWTIIGGPGSDFAVSDTAVYGLAPDLSYVAQYSPGNGWYVISGGLTGSQVNAIAAGG
ncbi:hypothetical protein KDK95_11950 [Actinospica sp. MGRD01-02]|uniref:Uncharacterized protein n=1 Tax=Actinospica acidithermotolerans TaxID=2828514 RepID=A0A941EB21_9ACTN|nr:hypothetical protein [Actinospica acidithermotolerans]MBR7827020.1 hypothetical protein [Actinospica acidithermotolerans]